MPKISIGSHGAFPYKLAAAQEEAIGELMRIIIATEGSKPSGHGDTSRVAGICTCLHLADMANPSVEVFVAGEAYKPQPAMQKLAAQLILPMPIPVLFQF